MRIKPITVRGSGTTSLTEIKGPRGRCYAITDQDKRKRVWLGRDSPLLSSKRTRQTLSALKAAGKSQGEVTIALPNLPVSTMPELHDRPLGTSPEHKVLHAVQQTGSRLVGDRSLASYLTDCLHIARGLGPAHKTLLVDAGLKRGAAPETITRLVAQAEDNMRWVSEMQAEDYHRVNVLAFLSLWSAHETGNENIVAAALSTINSAAVSAVSKFSGGRYAMDDWPWSDEKCLEIAQKLDQKAKVDTHEGGWDVAARLTTLFGWLGADIAISPNTANTLNEASMVRNVLLHRYGRLGPRDIERAPHLAVNENNAVQITRERLGQYSQAVNDTHVAVMHGVLSARWK